MATIEIMVFFGGNAVVVVVTFACFTVASVAGGTAATGGCSCSSCSFVQRRLMMMGKLPKIRIFGF